MTDDFYKEGVRFRSKIDGKKHIIKKRIIGGVVLQDENGTESIIGLSGLQLHYEPIKST